MTNASPKTRSFEALDAHGVQEALQEEMSDGQDSPDPDNNKDSKSPVMETETKKDKSDIVEEGKEGVNEAPVWTAAQMAEHARFAEALLFAAIEPLDEATLQDRLPTGADIENILSALQAQYQNRGIILSKISNKWRFVTAPDVAHILDKERVEPKKLSKAALETLAIIAYHQPCTRADIEDVRGVAVSKGSLDQLMEIGWVRLRGRRKSSPGRPVLYGTTQEFLEHFGLEDLGDLPGVADLKAAGLLDARLPPDFQIPTPSSEGDELVDEDPEDTEFTQDFMGDDDEIGDEADDDMMDE